MIEHSEFGLKNLFLIQSCERMLIYMQCNCYENSFMNEKWTCNIQNSLIQRGNNLGRNFDLKYKDVRDIDEAGLLNF